MVLQASAPLRGAAVFQALKKIISQSPRLEEFLRFSHYKLSTLSRQPLPPDLKSLSSERPLAKETRRILVDTTGISTKKINRGIQRVAINQLNSITGIADKRIEIIQVEWDKNGDPVPIKSGIHHQAKSAAGTIASDQLPLHVGPGDVYFTSNVRLDIPLASLQRLRAKGLVTYFTVYDLIPLTHPNLVPRTNQIAYTRWLSEILRVADNLICISNTVADEVYTWIDTANEPSLSRLGIHYCHLGCDYKPSAGRKLEEATLISHHPSGYYLMVGALEPRKSYIETIKSFEILWSKEFKFDLVIVGQYAGLGYDTRKAIKSSKFYKNKLFWYSSCSDHELSQLYKHARCLIAASVCEGFGLPIIEAAAHGTPVVARDIPIFREICADGAFYFKSTSPIEMAGILIKWEDLYNSARHPRGSTIKMTTWNNNSECLIEILSNRATPYKTVSLDDNPRETSGS